MFLNLGQVGECRAMCFVLYFYDGETPASGAFAVVAIRHMRYWPIGTVTGDGNGNVAMNVAESG